MFRRLATVAPRSVGTVVSPRVTPAISSIQAQPINRASPAPQRRSYHEKDKLIDEFGMLHHYNNPRNVGSLPKDAPDVGLGLVGAPACGDVMKLQIRVDKDTSKITDVKFKTFGCGSAIASSSYLTELVRGMTLDEASKIRNTDIAKELCLPPVKLHCSMLAEDAIKSAINDYYTKNPKAAKTDLSGTGASIPNVEKTEGSAASL
ncbi:iron-binding protein [Aspergillus viridinutans]|uniref:Iron-sulfur cluster assembly protein n=1 Tax=Aspergillus viridinutans TaxID=75553 RepID=A0A9P3BZY5_ASPVI|nr:iron-binding protein [Aspergillus viridinutans]GIK03693.1 iron-binding protein [Aspergillus viridinutans]